LRDGRFWLLTLAFVANAAALSALSVHLVAYLIEAGHPATFAATVAGLLGVLSVTGRLATTGLQRRTRPATVVAAVFAVQALAARLQPSPEVPADQAPSPHNRPSVQSGAISRAWSTPAARTPRYRRSRSGTSASTPAPPAIKRGTPPELL
jgi:hypothetical protein